eukprot:TRINITY_DN397_c0_g1_i1.p1 TRINITY_DN397_c0_g1~~TRINITY_DN397_c0_g1_i1.p1  ORF type:complete len:701 (-),score=162.89 TRINITY_DN397_c0_g1_i1:43-2145(-)
MSAYRRLPSWAVKQGEREHNDNVDEEKAQKKSSQKNRAGSKLSIKSEQEASATEVEQDVRDEEGHIGGPLLSPQAERGAEQGAEKARSVSQETRSVSGRKRQLGEQQTYHNRPTDEQRIGVNLDGRGVEDCPTAMHIDDAAADREQTAGRSSNPYATSSGGGGRANVLTKERKGASKRRRDEENEGEQQGSRPASGFDNQAARNESEARGSGGSRDRASSDEPVEGHGQEDGDTQEGEADAMLCNTTARGLQDEQADNGLLLDGVVFALSGIQNPERAQLRDWAVGAGAVYRPDWTADCTLLVCAFPNTPKFRSVKALGGTIVAKAWLKQCRASNRLEPIAPHMMHTGKPWRPIKQKQRSAEGGVIKGDQENGEPKSAQPIQNGENEKPSVGLAGKRQKMDQDFPAQGKGREEGSAARRLSVSDEEVTEWVKTDLAAARAFLESLPDKPEESELAGVAVKGVLTCLEDAKEKLESGKRIADVLEDWPICPQPLHRLGQCESGVGQHPPLHSALRRPNSAQRGHQSSSAWDRASLLTEVERFLAIYQSLLEEKESETFSGSPVLANAPKVSGESNGERINGCDEAVIQERKEAGNEENADERGGVNKSNGVRVHASKEAVLQAKEGAGDEGNEVERGGVDSDAETEVLGEEDEEEGMEQGATALPQGQNANANDDDGYSTEEMDNEEVEEMKALLVSRFVF